MVKPPGNKNDDYIPWIVCRDASDHVGMKKLNAGHIDPLLIKLAEDVRRLTQSKRPFAGSAGTCCRCRPDVRVAT